MIRVLLADDHKIVREGLRMMLEQTDDIRVTDEAANGDDALEKLQTNEFDVVVLDIAMPGQNGIEVLKRIKTDHPSVHVMMLSTYPEKQYALRALKAGASGYLTKDSATEELIVAIRRAAQGRKYLSAEIAERIADHFDDSMKAPHERLSDREYEVMVQLGKGNSVSMVAEILSISVPTVSTYRARILHKLNLVSNSELIHYTIENQLI
ncbi:MAG TPA: response regulator transcription factor [Bacteroidota bacterium]|nr:response regulator transcription factor [Bacteroidota bacterium]